MFKRAAVGLGALVLALVGAPALAAPAGSSTQQISMKVGACDPLYASRCIKPNADGSINISGSISAGSAWTQAGLANITVGSSSAATALPTASTNLWLKNTGLFGAYFALGTSNAVTATVGGSAYLAPGACTLVAQGANTYVAAITATSDGTTLQAQTGTGTPLGCTGIAVTAYNPPDASSTVTTGGSFQQVFAANSARINCFVQNPTSASEPLYVHWTSATPTVANSASLGPGSSFTCAGPGTVVTGAVSVEAATTGHAFTAAGN